MKLEKHTVSFVALSDVLEYMGYTHLQDDASDIFSGVTWGDSVYTISGLKYILDQLYNYLDTAGLYDQTWTDNQKNSFYHKAEELLSEHTFVDMES